ncbi:MAG TPA: zinc finger-like domain-containing protein, partial [Gemmatales bacterium]|nr:zinc finger-like domain-containing protein [Gemmatales bacterium]
MLVHADGLYPQKLIEERRPSESDAVKNYRKTIWKPITQDVPGRIITSLAKIRRSSDWSIKFDVTKQSERIVAGETLKEYTERNFPHFGSITNWTFGVLLKAYITDANALICTYPMQEEVTENAYVRPFPFIFYSHQVVEFVESDYAVVKSTDKVLLSDEANTWGDVYYILTTQYVERWEQGSSDRGMRMVWRYDHRLGELPVIKTKGLFKQSLENMFIFESRIKDIIPRLDEALREYSDLQAEVVQHIYSEKWEFVTDDCPTCKSKGYINGPGFNSTQVQCHTCKGTGNKPRGPYTTLQLKAPMGGESALPTPPIGYVQKDTSIVEIQDKRIDKHIYKALCAINFQFLEKVPQVESGLAKEVDKD